jgi:hypothetical protein
LTEPLRGRVAAILTRRELAINLGEDDGVQKGMRFAVLNRKGLHVTDPDTGVELGSVELPKVIVEVVRTQPKLCVARTFKKTQVNIGGIGVGVGRLFEPSKYVTRYETLRSDEKPYEEELEEEESYVKKGDPVVQVIGDEYIEAEDE